MAAPGSGSSTLEETQTEVVTTTICRRNVFFRLSLQDCGLLWQPSDISILYYNKLLYLIFLAIICICFFINTLSALLLFTKSVNY